MRLQIPQSISNSATIQDLVRFATKSLNSIQNIINGNVSLVDNCSTQILTFNFTKINSDVGVSHGLGSIPIGFIVVGGNTLTAVIPGKASNTASTFYLQAGFLPAATSSVQIMVFI